LVSASRDKVNTTLTCEFHPFILAKLLLDSIVTPETDEEADWQQLSLTAFVADWDNPEDAIYDNWRELYDVPTG
jgi:hypothetical protein